MSYYEDEIYHSGYLDGYYDSMELYHADDEMTEEERRARRRKRRRNIALGVAGAAGAGAAGYAIGRALRKRGRGIVPTGGPRLIGGPSGSSGSRPRGPKPTGPRLTGPTLKRVKVDHYYDVEEPVGWDFKKNKPRYYSDLKNEQKYKTYEYLKKHTEWDGNKKKARTVTKYDY